MSDNLTGGTSLSWRQPLALLLRCAAGLLSSTKQLLALLSPLQLSKLLHHCRFVQFSAMLQFFHKPIGVRVQRSRFLPVKSTSDLLAVQSNLFEIKHGR